MNTVTIDPITRIEGHLKVELEIEGGRVQSAESSGTLFRGLEEMLRGRAPRDATRITQRTCGVCPAAHAMASALALDDAFHIKNQIPPNGRLIRNLLLGANFIQSHVLHFYHLSTLDFVDPEVLQKQAADDPELASIYNHLQSSSGEPFGPQYSGDYRLSPEITADLLRDYLQGLEIRKKAHELSAIFGGKMPHNMGSVPGGTTNKPDLDMITKFQARLDEIQQFITRRYLPGTIELCQAYSDYFDIGQGVNRFLEYGGFYLQNVSDQALSTPTGLKGGVLNLEKETLDKVNLTQIVEEVTHSWYSDQSQGHPEEATTEPRSNKEEGYSWVKAPRYNSRPHEVGPAARMMINYKRGHQTVVSQLQDALDKTHADLKQIPSVCGRHLARAVECKIVAQLMSQWGEQLQPGQPSAAQYDIPEKGQGVGLTSAPRGTLGHWLQFDDRKITNYQMVVPTTWNASPRDRAGYAGPMEQALQGTRIEDSDNPLEAARIVRSFDPCMACAVH